jgi:DNA-binding Lrp family transcriptional regulator
MEEFRIIYRILRILKKSMDFEEFDREQISAEALGLSEPMWRRIMALLVKNGYIEGVKIIKCDQLDAPIIKYTGCPEITMKGLEYLESNSMMKKAADLAKGIVDIIT